MQKIDVAKFLIQERDNHFSQGLYDWSQVTFAYNSNHMEGSTLSEGQTQQLYDTETVLLKEGIQSKPTISLRRRIIFVCSILCWIRLTSR